MNTDNTDIDKQREDRMGGRIKPQTFGTDNTDIDKQGDDRMDTDTPRF